MSTKTIALTELDRFFQTQCTPTPELPKGAVVEAYEANGQTRWGYRFIQHVSSGVGFKTRDAAVRSAVRAARFQREEDE